MEILVEIDGKRQMIDDSLLEQTDGFIDNENEYTEWTEWRLNGEIVKRSAHITLKKNVAAEAIAAMLT